MASNALMWALALSAGLLGIFGPPIDAKGHDQRSMARLNIDVDINDTIAVENLTDGMALALTAGLNRSAGGGSG